MFPALKFSPATADRWQVTVAIERQTCTAFLNQIYYDCAMGNPNAAMRRACETFQLLRSRMQVIEWAEFCQRCILQHPARDLLQQGLHLTETFRSRQKQIADELKAIAQEKTDAAILSVEHVPVSNLEQRFDFVYATDLLESLDTVRAAKLLALLVGMLQPHGRLLVTNLAPGIPEAACLEACLSRIPQYRTEEDVAALTALIPETQISSQYIYRDETGGTVFLELQRAAR